MKSKKESVFPALLFIGVLFLQNANAIPVGGVSEATHSETFSIGGGSAIVDCEVFKYASGEYVYTYQITNQDSAVALSFFSIAISNVCSAYSPCVDSDPIHGYIDPVFWTVCGSPPESVNSLFGDTISSGETSAILWFISDDVPSLGPAAGVLSGTYLGAQVFSVGALLTPIPEPATLVLLGMGGLVVFTRKKWSA